MTSGRPGRGSGVVACCRGLERGLGHTREGTGRNQTRDKRRNGSESQPMRTPINVCTPPPRVQRTIKTSKKYGPNRSVRWTRGVHRAHRHT